MADAPKRKPAAKARTRRLPAAKARAKPKAAPRRTPAPRTAASDRDRLAAASRARAARGREIGGIPDVVDPDRREACRDSLRLFCETYNAAAFGFGWSDDHLAAIARIEEAATLGAMFAFAFPRGTGKTTLCRHAALWVLSYARRRYPFLIGATDAKARETLDTLRTFIRFLPDYCDDFPELSWPARALAGIANRASGQTCMGESTLIEWAADRIVMPTVPPPGNWPGHWPLRSDGMVPTSGILVSASGLTGEGIRGSLKTLTTGEMVRPDFVLLDDPQTPESARSPTQNETRLRLITADVLGMAGPGKGIAAVMPCTVISPGDMVDHVLDRGKCPLWRGERAGILRSMPANLPAWDAYFEVYARCAQAEPPDFAEANAYYRSRRAELDEGAAASWPDRKEPHEVSAVQHAMHLYFRDKRAFWSEYQNQPLAADLGAGAKSVPADLVVQRLSGTDRLRVPRECSRLTAMIDVGGQLHWYAVVAWTEAFGGTVVDYGPWPRQTRSRFQASDPRPGLEQAYPGLTVEQRVFAGLRDLTAEVLGRVYLREQTGDELRVERCLVDGGWKPAPVYQFVRSSPHAAILYPSKGVGRTTTSRGVSEWKPRPGERAGPHWRLTTSETGKGRMVQFDPDFWKTHLHERLTVPMGGPEALTLWGRDAAAHALVGDHLAAETAAPVTLRGATFDKWQQRPDRPDNHLLDALVGCAVAASVQGLRAAAGGGDRPAGAKPKPAISLRDLQLQRRAEKAEARR